MTATGTAVGIATYGGVTGTFETVTLRNNPLNLLATLAYGPNSLDVTLRIIVPIDVKPGSALNPINLQSEGTIPVAVLTTPTFDASRVNVPTVRFAGAAPLRGALEDVDRDGDLDLVLHFSTTSTTLLNLYRQLLIRDRAADGVLDSTRQTASVLLTGETVDHVFFAGADQVQLFLAGSAQEDRPHPSTVGIDWVRQFGGVGQEGYDIAQAAAANGSLYVVGGTDGTLPGQTSAGGGLDAFVRKYDAAGNVLWTRQFGTGAYDYASGVVVDATGVYIVGYTEGVFPGQTSAGSGDAFVRKYDAAGNLLWTRQFGSTDGDVAFGVAADGTGIYVVGQTDGALPGQVSAGGADAFVRKYDAAGNVLWTRQFGSSGPYDYDAAYGVTADATGVYVAGYTSGDLPGQTSVGGYADAFVRKYDAAGNILWTRQFGTASYDYASGVAADATGVYVAGYTYGNLDGTSAGGLDAFVRKYDTNGSVRWTSQFGTDGFDYAYGVAADGTGVYVVGFTEGTLLPDQVSAGGGDAFVRKYDANGGVRWTSQFGTAGFDLASGVAADATGVYVAGYTYGNLDGTSAGGSDAFVRKYDAAGSVAWTRQFGGDNFVAVYGVAADASGVYVVGETSGALPGQVSAGLDDAFARKYNSAGNELWTVQFGTDGFDGANGVAVDTSNRIYAVGFAEGALPGQTSAGLTDAFVVKLAPGATPAPLLAADLVGPSAGVRAVAGAEPLTPELVRPLLGEALARWQAAGRDTAGLGAVTVEVADLPDGLLGLAAGLTIWLDVDAAGYGWFLDLTPWDDVEFPAGPDSPAYGRMDLLTALAHELGHLLGFEHDDADDVMGATLAAGERRLPGPAETLANAPLDLAFAEWASSLIDPIDLVLKKGRSQ